MCANHDHTIQDLNIQVVDGQVVVSGQFRWATTLDQDDAPNQTCDEVDRMGQALKRHVYQQLLQHTDGQLAQLWQQANPNWQKRGHRPYTFVTPFGRVTLQRQRLHNKTDGSWRIPSHQRWDTPHRQCIVRPLREQTCDRMRDLSVRETNQSLAQQADCQQLLGNSTVLKILHQEGSQLAQAQRQRAEHILEQHPQAKEKGLVTLPANEPPNDTDNRNPEPAPPMDEEPEVQLTADQQQQVWERAVGFLNSPPDGRAEEPTETAASTNPGPRQADADAVVVQVDEVKTKAQACCAGKENWTYTAYIQMGQQRYYVAEETAEQLWQVLAALLCALGVLVGRKRLLLIADGARWIGNWYAGLDLPGKERILCWFHLAKKVYELLSGAGLGKERRAELEHEVLHEFWHGNVANGLWLLWGAREQARCPGKVTELIRYLLRRRDQLPDYRARQSAGLMVTSNRVEKWNDWAVSDRCKRRGMSWTGKGVLSLAVLESARRNEEMDEWRTTRELPPYQPEDASANCTQAA